MLTNVTAIIRSSGERTEALCEYLVKQQVDPKNVVVIHERPFSQALRKSYEIGVDYDLEWTLCVDADILVRTEAIDELISAACDIPETAFFAKGRIVDKLLNVTRVGGLPLYRTSLLKLALQKAHFSPHVIRPEAFVKEQMAEMGFQSAILSIVTGLHDYHQYYKDIYRKAIVHFHKHPKSDYREQMWKFLAKYDDDFKVALLGSNAAKTYQGAIRIDVDEFPSNIERLLNDLGLTEKQPLVTTSVSTDEINQIVNNQSPEYWLWQNSLRRKKLRLMHRYKKLGPVTLFPELVRMFMRRVL